MKQLFSLIFVFFFIEGCAVMNTFQTPTVKKPGKVSLGLGGGLSLIDRDNKNFGYPIVPLDGYIRVGVVPGIDVGLRTAGFISYGADIKYQFLKAPFPMSVNAGFGSGMYKYAGFGSSGIEKSTTRFVGVIAGYGQFYYGFKLTDYFYRKESEGDQGDSPTHVDQIDKLIPAVSLGFTAPDNQALSPMFEINSYLVPQIITTASVGLKVNF